MRLIFEADLEGVEIPAGVDEVVVRLSSTDITIKMPSAPEYEKELVALVAAVYGYEYYLRGAQGDWSMGGIADRVNQYLAAQGEETISAHLVGHVMRSLGFESRRTSQFNGRYAPVKTAEDATTWSDLIRIPGFSTYLRAIQGHEKGG
jgi:hypothetical protein